MSTSGKEILMFKFEEPLAMCVSLGQSANVVFVYEDGEDTDFNEVAIRTSPGEGCTRVPKGYKHFYIGGGSHLVIREDKYDAYITACGDLADKDNRYELDFDDWMKFIPALFDNENTQA